MQFLLKALLIETKWAKPAGMMCMRCEVALCRQASLHLTTFVLDAQVVNNRQYTIVLNHQQIYVVQNLSQNFEISNTL